MTGYRNNLQLLLSFVPSFASFSFSVLAFLMCTFYHREAIMVGRVNRAEQGGSVYFMVWQTRAFINDVKVYSFCFFIFLGKKNPSSASETSFPTLLLGLHFRSHSPSCSTRWMVQHHFAANRDWERPSSFEGISLFLVSFQALHFPLCQLVYLNSACSARKPKSFWTPASKGSLVYQDAEGICHLHLPLRHIFVSRKLAAFKGHECFLQNLVSEPWDKSCSRSFTKKWWRTKLQQFSKWVSCW